MARKVNQKALKKVKTIQLSVIASKVIDDYNKKVKK